MLPKLWFKIWCSVAHSIVDPEKRLRNLFHSEQVEKVEFPFRFKMSWKMGIKFSHWNRFWWFRFSWIHNVPGEWLIIIVAHAARVPINSVSATKASCSTLCSTLASPKPSSNGPSCWKDSYSTSSMSSSSPNSVNISSSTTCTSKNAHLIINIVSLVIKVFPSLDFASLSPSVPLISSLPSHGSKMALTSSSEITPASSSGSFSSRKSSYSKAASASLWLPWQVAERGKQLTFEQKLRQELEHEHPKTTWSLKRTTQCEASCAILLACDKWKQSWGASNPIDGIRSIFPLTHAKGVTKERYALFIAIFHRTGFIRLDKGRDHRWKAVCSCSEWTVCKIQRHLGLPGSAILKVVSLVSRLLDREALIHAHQYKSLRSL